jgi:pantoate--beta-alanine ligase
MSSRNRYLSPQDRAAAATLPAAMKAAIGAIASGDEARAALDTLEAALVEAGFASVDYAVLADAATLAPINTPTGSPARLLVAARIGGTRLIDNMAVG